MRDWIRIKTSATTAALVMFCTSAPAADIYFDQAINKVMRPEDSFILSVRGELKAGDSDRFLEIAKKSPSLSRVELNSPGGSVIEGIKIAETIRFLHLDTRVASRGYCASSCFFMFIGGSFRWASSAELMTQESRNRSRNIGISLGLPKSMYDRPIPGFVGVHRPYVEASMTGGTNQTEAMFKVRQYLQMQLVPYRLIDMIMSRPSNDIYWLSASDFKELGDYPAGDEEIFVQQCGYIKNASDRILEGGMTQEQISQLNSQRDEADKCIQQKQAFLQSQARIKLMRGWRPSDRPM